ncbi:hypothetical protein ACJX0J_010145, partial [Zea mays]
VSEEGQDVPAVRRGGDAAVEVGADGAGHALQRLPGSAQGGRGTAGSGEAPPHASDRQDARPAAPRQPGLEEASETGETLAASEDGTRGGAAASASGIPRQEEEEIGFGEEAVAAPEGRLLPEYRPLASPTFEPSEHANKHSQVMQLHRQRKSQGQHHPLPAEHPRAMDVLQFPQRWQAYTALRSAGKSVEIIFVSLDRDEASFRDHFQGMSWLAVPFDAAGLLRQKLCARFAIERIPALIPLSASATPSSGLGCGEDAVRLVGEYGVDAYPFSAQRRRELESMDDARRGGGRLQELLGCEERDYVISADDIK